MNFNVGGIQLTTLVGYFEEKDGANPRHVQIPIDPTVQNELKHMLTSTIERLGDIAVLPVFSPAEKYSGEEATQLPLNTPYVADLADVIALQNLPSDVNALADIDELKYYYAVFRDQQQRKLFAFHLAKRFKAAGKGSLMHLDGGTLKMVSNKVFQLDNDFDYFVDDQTIFILRSHGFEYSTQVHNQIMQSAVANSAAIKAQMGFLDLTSTAAYATTHSRSAKLLAAIRARTDLHLIDQNLLIAACAQYGVALEVNDGLLGPASEHEHEFLLILDRRGYTAILIPNTPEKYEAPSRIKKS
jgi:hypothetical protein